MTQPRKKTPEQVAAIEGACRATERALEAVIEYVRTSAKPRSEEAHSIIDRVLQERGFESPEGHIVAGGPENAEPHERGSGIIRKNAPVVIDIFPRSKESGFFADMTRTVFLGEPSPQLRNMHEAVLAAQELGISMLRPGVRCADVHMAVADFFAEAGYSTSGKGKEFPFAEGFVHGLGHGVGLEIHERPRLGRNSEDVLEEGDVITVEPGLYYPDLGGIRIEDMFLITASGARELTRFPKESML